MAPANRPLSIWRGNTETFRFRLRQSDGAPVDLTGAKLVFKLAHDGGILAKASGEDDAWTIADPATGQAELFLTAAETRSLAKAVRAPSTYELEWWSGREQRTLLAGKVNVEGGVNDD